MSATALATDLYQLTMMAGYFVTGRHETSTATFELFVRRLPARRSFLITAGLESFVEFLERLEFDDEEVERLRDEPGLRGVPPSVLRIPAWPAIHGRCLGRSRGHSRLCQ